MRLFRQAYLLFLLLFPLFIHGQASPFPITEWKTKLSCKNDIGYLKLEEVTNELKVIDSTRRCEAFRLLKEQAENGNTRFQIRMAVIWVWVSYLLQGCTDSITNHERLEIALRKCYESGDNMLAIIVHQALCNTYLTTNETGLAIVHALAGKELMEKEGLHLFRNYSRILYSTADLLYRSRDYRAAAKL